MCVCILYDIRIYSRTNVYCKLYLGYMYICIHDSICIFGYIHITVPHFCRCGFLKQLPLLVLARCRNSGKRDPRRAPSMSGSTRLSSLLVSLWNEGGPKGGPWGAQGGLPSWS